MRHRPGVFGELVRAQRHHVADPLHRRGGLVGGELLVAEHREPFLQRELEPVAARDAVAGPVVEVLVADHRLDRLVLVVGRGVGLREHVLRVEDVEALVLHRAHVEIADRDDHVHVELVLEAEHLLVPAHRALERAQRVLAAVGILRLHPDLERDLAPGARREGPRVAVQVARDQREQVRGLGRRVAPAHRVATAGEALLGLAVAVREQHGIALAVGLDPHRIARHHVGAVEEPGDAAEAVRLALGAEVAAAAVEARERGVALGVDPHERLEREALGRRGDLERLFVDRVLPCGERSPVDRDRERLELLAREHERQRAAEQRRPPGGPRAARARASRPRADRSRARRCRSGSRGADSRGGRRPAASPRSS